MQTLNTNTKSILGSQSGTTGKEFSSFSRWMNGLVVLFSILLLGVTNANAQVIFSENFESTTFTTPSTLVPSWSTAGTDVNALWQANNYTTGWASSGGGYSPTGANGTTKSMRFHTYDAPSAAFGELYSPILDFSSTPGEKALSFYYNNTSGTDYISISFSTNGGTTYGAELARVVVPGTGWTLFTFPLGNTTSSTCMFRIRATSDFGTTDLGIDEVSVSVYNPSSYINSSTSVGGLWSDPNTWVGGNVPRAGISVVTIASGANVAIDVPVIVNGLTIDGTLQWGAASNALTVSGPIQVNSTGKLYGYNAGTLAIQTINCQGNFVNDGLCELYYTSLNFNGTSAASQLSGSGTFVGSGGRGFIRSINSQNGFQNTINTTQPLTITSGMAHTAGQLNTNGKLRADNAVNWYGDTNFLKVRNVVVTSMGTNMSVQPVVFSVAVVPYASGASVSSGTRYYFGENVYLATAAGTFNSTAPTSTDLTTTFTSSGPSLIYIGKLGTIGTNLPFNSTLSLTTQYFVGDNLYQATATTATTVRPTHTSGTVSNFRYMGRAAKVAINWDATNKQVRTLTLVNAGSGLNATPSIVFSIGATGATGTLPTATAMIFTAYSSSSAFVVQKSSGKPITGGLEINSDGGATALTANPQSGVGVGTIFGGGGANYTVAPTIGFTGPTALNLVTNTGSGYTSAPTVTVTGGTLVTTAGTNLLSTDFTVNVSQGKVVSVYLNNSTTKAYSVPPTITLTGGGGAGATIAWPTGCWPTATASIMPNGQLSYTLTNPGFGYSCSFSGTTPTNFVTAFVDTNRTRGGGAYTAAAGGTVANGAAPLSVVMPNYFLRLALYIPSSSTDADFGVEQDAALIPASRKVTVLDFLGNSLGLTLSNNLTLTASTPLVLTSTGGTVAPGSILYLNGNNLRFNWRDYAGTSASLFTATSKVYFTGGSVTLTSRGGGTAGQTFNFPFAGAFTTFTGTGATVAAGSDVTSITVTENNTVPANDGGIGTGLAFGKRSFRVQATTTGGGTATLGTNPTVTMNFNSLDSLTASQENVFIVEGSGATGPWNLRSTALGTGVITAVGTKSTETIAPGPITYGSGNYFAWGTATPTITSVTSTVLCANSGSFAILGTNFTGVTAVTINGLPVLSFTIDSASRISCIAGAQTTGFVSVVKNGVTITGTQEITVGSSPAAPTPTAASATVLVGQQTTLGATGIGGTLNWYGQAAGGTLLGTGESFTTPANCATRTYYVTESNGSCEGARAGVVVNVTRSTITATTSTYCGEGSTRIDTLTLNNADPNATITWTSLTAGTTLTANGTVAYASMSLTSEFRAVVSNNSCQDTARFSVGVYPLPTATVTTTASGVCPGTSATINSGLTAGNFTATCITPVTSLSTPPSNATTLISNGVAQTLPSGVSWSSSLDDGKFGPIPIGFDFNFFGASQTSLNIGTNGVVNFGSYASFSGSQYVFAGGFPNSANPANTVAVGARDLRFGTPSGFGSLRYWVEGVAPNRRFIVQFDNVPIWSGVVTTAGSQSGFNNAEAVFYETTGTIDIRVISATNGTSTTAAEINKYIGLQDGTKTIGATAPNCTTNVNNFWNGTSTSITSAQAWRFAPPANYTTTWFANFEQFATGTNIFSQSVAPLATTLYSISYTNQTTGCTNEARSAEVNMVVLGTTAPAGVNTLSSADSICAGANAVLSIDYGGITDGLTFQWQSSTDGGSTWNDITGATTTSYTAVPTALTSYRVKIISCGGAPSYSSAKTIFFRNFISSTTGSTQCGFGAPTLEAVANEGATINWYAAATGGSVIGSGSPFTAASISSTTTYYVAAETIGCSSLRTAVTATVTPAPTFTLSTNGVVICQGQTSSAATITAGAADYDQYVWTPSTGVSGSAAAGWSFNPSATTAYELVASQSAGACRNRANVSVTVNANPVITAVTASSSAVCAGTTVTLNGTSVGIAASSNNIGAGTSTSSAAGTPFYGGYGGTKVQYIFTAAELTAAGFVPGNITGLALDVTTAGIGNNYGGFKVTAAQTSQSSFGSTTAITGLTEVFSSASYVATAGLNQFNFTSPINWNGTSNIVVGFCYSNNNASNPGSTVKVETLASTNRQFFLYADDASASAICGATVAADAGGFSQRGSTRPIIRFYGQLSGVNNSALLNWSWTPGALTGSTVTVNPTVTTTYTVNATNPTTGCVSPDSTITVTAYPLPSAPQTSNSEQCGYGVPTCFATGAFNGDYRWYTTATGGTALVGQTNSTLSGYNIDSTKTFYVAISDGTCESLRTPVTATVTQPDAIAAVASSAAICLGSTVTLTASQTGSTNTYTYEWTSTTGSGITGTVTGSPATVTPTAVGNYTYSVVAIDGTCRSRSSISVTVNPNPVISSATATPSTICAGETSVLNAQSVVLGNGTADIGTAGASTISTTGTPYRTGTTSGTSHRTQYLVRASELTAAGIQPGNITSLGFTVTTTAPTGFMSPLTIKMGATDSVSLSTTTYSTVAVSQVYTVSLWSPANGLNNHEFQTPFVWNGTSNILIEVCGTLTSSGTGSGTTLATQATTYNATLANNTTCDATTGSTPGNLRPVLTFGGTTPVNLTEDYVWSWNPGAVNSYNTSVTPSSTTTYTTTATNLTTGCTSTATATVTVNPVPSAPTGTGSEQCGSAVPTASVSSNFGAASPVFKWYTQAVGGTAVQEGTSTTFTSSLDTTTVFYVSEISAAGCEGPRVQVTATVTPPDALTVAASVAQVCLNGTFTVTPSYVPSANTYTTYSMTASPEAGSGITGSVSLTANATGAEAYSVTPSAAGTYIYTITANDPEKGCNVQARDTVIVNSLPVIDSVKASAMAVCSGSALTLNGYSGGIGGGPQTQPTGYGVSTATSSSDSEIGRVLFGTMNNISDCGSTGGGSSVLNRYSDFTSLVTAPTLTAGDSIDAGVGVAYCGTSAFSNRFILYVDWNRDGDFTDSSEAFVSKTYAAAALGGTFYSGRFRVPTFATPGLTRMRVVLVESATVNPTGTYTYGETEDYVVNVLNFVTVNPALTYTWNPGAVNGSTVTVNPTVNTNYTLTVTDANGCTKTSSPLAITAYELPAAPVASNSTQCGSGVPTASVSTGGANGTFNWYNDAVGGTVINTGSTYPNTISATDTFYVSESNGQCESPRTAVTVTVTTPPAISTTGSTASAICLNGTVTLAASSEAAYNYTWTSTAGSGITGSVTGSSATVTPTVAGTYVYTVNGTDGSCATSATVTVTVNPNPIITSVSASNTTICAGSSSTLTAASVVSGPAVVAVGSGSVSQSTSGQTPFSQYYEGQHTQYLIRASDLTANGLQAGNLSGIQFDVTTASSTFSFTNYTVKIAHTDSTALSGLLSPTFSTVYGPATYAPVTTTGWKAINFASPFNWNGTSNIVLDICFSNDPGATGTYYSANSTVAATAKSYTAVYGYYADNSALCGTTGGTSTSSVNLPNIKFDGISATNIAGSYNWTWTPGAIAGNPVTVNPTSTTSYTATATNTTTGCSTTSSAVEIVVTPVSANATSSATGAVCAGSSVVLNANPVGQGPFTYSWSDGTNVVSTAATPTVNPTVNTTYIVTVFDACNNPAFSSVSVEVTALSTASINEAGPFVVCQPVSQTLTASSSAPGTFQWTLNGVNIPGANSSTYTASVTGTYAVKVTDSLTACTSLPSASVSITTNPQPSVITFSPATPSIAYGGSIAVTANGGALTNNGVVAMSENFNGTTPWTITSNGTSPAAANWSVKTAPFSNATSGATFTNFSTPNGGGFIFASGDVGGSGTTTNTVIASPSFSLVNYTSASMTYEHAFRRISGDLARVEVSTDGGTSWSQLKAYTSSQGTTTSNAQATVRDTLNMNAYIGQADVKVRFNYVSPYGYWWLVDNVTVSGNTSVTQTITWSPSATLSTSTGATVTAAPTTTTTYTATSTTAQGCTRTADVTVTVRPTATLASLNTSVCPGTSTALSIAVVGNGPWSGTLSDGTAFSGSASPIAVNVAPTTSTTYTIATLSDASGTSISTDLSGSAFINVKPTSASSESVTICASELPYSWNGNSYSAAGSYTINLTNYLGCDSAVTLNLTVNSCTNTLNVKAFLEGYYRGAGSMAATMYDLGLSTDVNATDSIEVNLWSASSLGNATPNYSVKVMLHTNGNATALFPAATLGNAYYIAIKHRNSIETWSANAITIQSVTSYDFTTGLVKAFNDGVTPSMKSLGGGVFGFYGGDVNLDGTVDGSDMNDVDNNTALGAFGYDSSDVNGDGATDGLDMNVVDNNTQIGLFYARPY